MASGPVQVVVRLRPQLPDEPGVQSHLTLQDTTVTVYQTKSFEVDKVAAQNDSQAAFFQASGVQQLVAKVVKGYHGTVFAYGQTGSGKTYTMEGYVYRKTQKGPQVDLQATPQDRLGIVARAVRCLFDEIKIRYDGACRARVLCSFVQVYREQVLDLLNPSIATAAVARNMIPQGLKVRWSAMRDFYVENLFVEQADDADHALSLFESGIRHKIVAETRMNAASSRSHCIFTLTVQHFEGAVGAGEPVTESRLALVDLAGSERQNALDDMTSKAALQDSVEINKSLFTLRKVILSLSDEATNNQGRPTHVAYRDSTLTKLLKNSLGGNCQTLMIACISPSDAHADENCSTLAYAARARAIINKPVVNLEPRAMEVQSLKDEVVQLKAEIVRMQKLMAIGDSSIGGIRVGNPFKDREKIHDQNVAAPKTSSDPALQRELEYALERESQAGAGLAQGVELARQLATANGRLREACDGLKVQRDELNEAQSTLMDENCRLRERVQLAEMALAMESYPSAMPDSFAAQVEQQLRTAALSLMQLRAENHALQDRIASAPCAHSSCATESNSRTARDVSRAKAGARRTVSKSSGKELSESTASRVERGSAPDRKVGNAPSANEEDAVPRASAVLSSTGRLNLSQLASEIRVPSSQVSDGASGMGNFRCVAGSSLSTFAELDELSALMRKKAELKSRRK